jgi:outer membrane protein assembly factor BamB
MKPWIRRATVLGLGVLGFAGLLNAADWPNFRGPTREATSPETGLLKSWPKSGPKLAWTTEDLGSGFGAPAIVGGKIYVPGTVLKDETLFGLGSDGKVLWKAPIGPVYDFDSNAWSGGPNGTPAVADGKVVCLGSQGILICVDAASGKELWRHDLPKALGAEVNPVGGGPDKFGWGFSWSPIIEDGKVIITPGGASGLVAALDLTSGKPVWQSKEIAAQATYSTPTIATIGGKKQIVALTQNGPVGVSFADGKLLWAHKKEAPYPDVVCTSPIVSEDMVYVSVGFGAGAEAIKIKTEGENQKAESLWSEKEIANDNGGVVLHKGHIYGYHLKRGWQCQELATGKKVWESKRGALGAGSLLVADGLIFALGEDKAEVGLIEAKTDKYTEKGKFKLPKESTIRKARGKVWTHPVLADGKLYLRDHDLLFCYEVK